MERQIKNIRVLLASEYPEMRSFLKDMVEAEERAVIVGEAENAIRALTLARNLRPDVAIIDSCLPLNVGLDTNPLTRISGLDAAETISEEIPNARVVLLNRPIDRIWPENNWGVDIVPFFCREANETCIPFTIGELRDNGIPSSALVFARVEASTKAVPRHRKINDISDKAIFFGGLGILGGWFLVIALWLAPPGIFLALAGAASVLVGLAGKLILKIFK